MARSDINTFWCGYVKPTRVSKNNPSVGKAVQYAQSTKSGHGRKGCWQSVVGAIKLPKYNIDYITAEDVDDWVKNNKIDEEAEKVLSWYNDAWDCGWNI